MHAFSTYCSVSKSHESGSIPAIHRYQSPRIGKVFSAASCLGLRFYILSGMFGLIPPQELIPFYDHLLKPEEVPGLAELIIRQIHEYEVSGLVYFTKPLSSNRNLIPYRDALVIACEGISIPFYVVRLEHESMSTWRAIMKAADEAKIRMVSDRMVGEEHFESLLAQNPQDGMIYFKRGEACEAIGEAKLAAFDFQRAMALFPRPEWKARAKEALDRVKGAA